MGAKVRLFCAGRCAFSQGREFFTGKPLPSLGVGDFITRRRTFRQEDLVQFSGLVGDKNPIHLDPQFAASTIFKKPIVYGFLSGGMFSEILGNTFTGAVYLSQTLNFRAPVFVDEEVEARLEILEIINKKKIRIRTTVRKVSEDKLAIDGEALIY